MIKMLFVLCSSLFLFAGLGGAQAQSEADKLALARAYMSHNMKMMDIEKVASVSVQPLLSVVKRENPDISSEQLEKLNKKLSLFMSEYLKDVIEEFVDETAEIFTYEELKALDAFYRTPEGQGVMKKMPEFMSKMQPVIMNSMMSTGPEMVKLIAKEGFKTR